jgi:hypothetical protein
MDNTPLQIQTLRRESRALVLHKIVLQKIVSLQFFHIIYIKKENLTQKIRIISD